MTGSAGCSVAPGVIVVAGVAGVAGCWQAGIDTTGMTPVTGRPGMGASERETGGVMVEGGREPGGGGVAGGAVRAKKTMVFIVTGVTGVTGGGSAEVDMIHMTGGARCSDMRPSQFEDRKVVVK